MDGFLTGTLVGPELIMPSEWLPRVWGGKTPKFANEEHARLILSTIMGRYNEIAAAVEAGPSELDSVFCEHGDGTVMAADWAKGFREAIELRADAWTPLFQDEELGLLLIPILALCGEDDGSDLLPIPLDIRKAMLVEAPELIPFACAPCAGSGASETIIASPLAPLPNRDGIRPAGAAQAANTSAAAAPISANTRGRRDYPLVPPRAPSREPRHGGFGRGRFAPEADLLRQARAGPHIIGGHHRMLARQSPTWRDTRPG